VVSARGLIGGFIGAGLFGMLFGNGLFWRPCGGGMSSLALLLRSAFCSCCLNLSWALMRAAGLRSQGAGPQSRPGSRIRAGRRCRFCGLWRRAGERATRDQVAITPADFGVFEQRLSAIQTAFGAEDSAI